MNRGIYKSFLHHLLKRNKGHSQSFLTGLSKAPVNRFSVFHFYDSVNGLLIPFSLSQFGWNNNFNNDEKKKLRITTIASKGHVDNMQQWLVRVF